MDVGYYDITVTLKTDNYKGSAKVTMKVRPQPTSISSLANISGGFKVKWKKQETQTDGYQIQYATDKSFKTGAKSVLVKKTSTTAKNVTGLEPGKTYYMRIRTYKTVDGQRIYSAWSSVKSVKIK